MPEAEIVQKVLWRMLMNWTQLEERLWPPIIPELAYGQIKHGTLVPKYRLHGHFDRTVTAFIHIFPPSLQSHIP